MDDLISRQGTCDSLNKYRIEKMLEGKDISLVWECIDKVLQEPSAQPERKKGKWIVHIQRGNWNDEEIRTCPICGKTFRNLEIANYCPNCGLPMETEVEE